MWLHAATLHGACFGFIVFTLPAPGLSCIDRISDQKNWILYYDQTSELFRVYVLSILVSVLFFFCMELTS